MKVRSWLVTLVALSAATALAACAPPDDDDDADSGSGTDAKSATSAEDFGGMDELVKAAKKEGKLNVIALPPDWANYGEIIEAFSEKYDIKVNSDQPDGASQDEINAADQLKGTERAPDVFDLGQSVALANTDMFAPYKVATWDDIPTGSRTPTALWVNDYGGYMSIGYDSSKVPDVTTVDDLLEPGVQGQGRAQRRPDRGRRGVQRRDDGLARQRRLGRRHRSRRGVLPELKEAGNFLPVDPDPGDDRVRPDPGGHRLGLPERRRDREARRPGRSSCPPGPWSAATTSRRSTPMRRTPRRPGSGRSSSTATRARTSGSPGGARPVRADAMVEAGTIDEDAVRRPAGGRRHARDPDQRADRAKAATTWPRTGPRRSAEHDRTGGGHDRHAPPARRAGASASARRSGCCPFLAFLGVFLIIPTVTVAGRRVPGRRGRLLPWRRSASSPTRRRCTCCARAWCSRSRRAWSARSRRPAGLPGRHGAARPACCAGWSPRSAACLPSSAG